MMQMVIIEKQVGETPLMALAKWKEENPMYKDVPAAYAGRLDPMAQGKLLVLLGDECRRQQVYVGLDKEYEIEVLLDVSSDTGDALGLVEYPSVMTNADRSVIDDALQEEVGVHTLPYPQYSSKTVLGKPLFLYALEGKIDTIEIPKHEERIDQIKMRRIVTASHTELKTRVDAFLAKVPTSNEPSKALGSDFRIHAVRASWEKLFKVTGDRAFTILSLCVTCGSGTYMRSLAGRIGKSLGTAAIALSINRTKIGTYRNGHWTKCL